MPLPTIVLTAGLGTRLDPITRVLAKPAVPVAGQALVERVLAWLAAEGVTDTVLNLHHLPGSITGLLGDGAACGVRVRYSWESQVLGSAGGPKRALRLWPDHQGSCLIVNGDTLTDVSLAPLIAAHRTSGARVTMAVVQNPRPDHYNGIRADDQQRVTGFAKKGDAEGTWHFVGVQVVEADVFDLVAEDTPTETVAGVYRDLVLDAPGAVRVWPVEASFIDVGTPADYIDAVMGLVGADVGPDQVVREGTSSYVAPSARLRRCVIWDGGFVGADAQLTGCVVLTGARVAEGTVAENQVFTSEV